jgi:hypothetical protein
MKPRCARGTRFFHPVPTPRQQSDQSRRPAAEGLPVRRARGDDAKFPLVQIKRPPLKMNCRCFCTAHVSVRATRVISVAFQEDRRKPRPQQNTFIETQCLGMECSGFLHVVPPDSFPASARGKEKAQFGKVWERQPTPGQRGRNLSLASRCVQTKGMNTQSWASGPTRMCKRGGRLGKPKRNAIQSRLDGRSSGQTPQKSPCAVLVPEASAAQTCGTGRQRQGRVMSPWQHRHR